MTPTLIEFPNRGNLALAPEVREDPIDAERRAHKRMPGDEVPWLGGIRLKYGPAVRVIDVSRGGAQIETIAHRLNPGATVVCEIAAAGSGLVIPAQVVRCHLAQLLPEPSYRGSIAFKRLLDVPGFDLGAHGASGSFHPIHEHARLLRALRKRAERRDDSRGALGDQSAALGGDPLSAALALLHAPAGRRGGETFSRELALLFRTLSRGLDADLPPAMLVASLEDRLTRAIGLRAARLAVSSMGRAATESICFDVPAPGRQIPRKLLIEFRDRQEPAEWHFHLLRAAVHLFALVRELDVQPWVTAQSNVPSAHIATTSERNIEDTPRPAAGAPPPPAPVRVMPSTAAGRGVDAPAAIGGSETVPASEPTTAEPRDLASAGPRTRIVVRYTDGRLLKGYAKDFNPANGYAEVWPDPAAPPEARIRVPFGALKAIFFVRDFDGDPNRVDATVLETPRTEPRRGRPITVTFLDDEVLAGRTMNYQVDGPGFFVTPHDDGANNERVFVLSRAIRHVRFG